MGRREEKSLITDMKTDSDEKYAYHHSSSIFRRKIYEAFTLKANVYYIYKVPYFERHTV